jgi:hypothetical protein
MDAIRANLVSREPTSCHHWVKNHTFGCQPDFSFWVGMNLKATPRLAREERPNRAFLLLQELAGQREELWWANMRVMEGDEKLAPRIGAKWILANLLLGHHKWRTNSSSLFLSQGNDDGGRLDLQQPASPTFQISDIISITISSLAPTAARLLDMHHWHALLVSITLFSASSLDLAPAGYHRLQPWVQASITPSRPRC